jgi:hypothetical protein
MPSHKYTGIVREAKGQKCHYAKVTLAHTFQSNLIIENTISNYNSEEILPEWLERAVSTVKSKAKQIGLSGKIQIIEIDGSLSDTTTETICKATTKAVEEIFHHIR